MASGYLKRDEFFNGFFLIGNDRLIPDTDLGGLVQNRVDAATVDIIIALEGLLLLMNARLVDSRHIAHICLVLTLIRSI